MVVLRSFATAEMPTCDHKLGVQEGASAIRRVAGHVRRVAAQCHFCGPPGLVTERKLNLRELVSG
jgi:hypothetical protein